MLRRKISSWHCSLFPCITTSWEKEGSTVVQAKHTVTKATYAVKKAVDLNEETGAALDVLEDEVSALPKLFRGGPHIVRIIDVVEVKTHIYIIMGEMMEHTKSGIAAVFGIDAADSEVNMIGFPTIGTCDLGPTKTLDSEMTLTLLTAVKLSWCPVGTVDRRLGQPECCCSI